MSLAPDEVVMEKGIRRCLFLRLRGGELRKQGGEGKGKIRSFKAWQELGWHVVKTA